MRCAPASRLSVRLWQLRAVLLEPPAYRARHPPPALPAGDWMSTTSVLEQLLARHVLLAEHQNGLSGAQPVPTPEGTPAVTEAGQRIELFSANAAAAARVVTLGARPDTIPINGTRRGCNVELYGVDGVLLGPDPPAAA